MLYNFIQQYEDCLDKSLKKNIINILDLIWAMAFASGFASDYYSDHQHELKYSQTGSSSKHGPKTLDFYASMYHFRKMFPKFESDVIETVLRANNGAVDKTIDQLLSMSNDYESTQTEQYVDLGAVALQPTSTLNANDTLDLPPSYNEFMSTKMSEKNIDLNSKIKPETVIDLVEDKIDSTLEIEKIETGTRCPIRTVQRAADRSKIMIGELSKDFLRIRLNSEQVKKLKTTIKKAKRNELTAIINNVIDNLKH